MSCGNRSFNLFKTPVIFEHLFEILSVCFFHFKLVSIVNPKKLNSSTFSMLMPSIFNVRCCICFLGMKSHIFRFVFIK